MKSIINKILSGRGIALALIACLASSAWAVVPTVAWDGDFGTTEKIGSDGVTYTFATGTGNSVVDGKLVVGSGNGYGGVITWPLDATKGVVSVLVKYSSLDITNKGTPVLAAVTSMQCHDDGTPKNTIIDDCVGVKENNGSKLTGRFNNNTSAWGGEVADIKSPSGYLLMVYTSGQELKFWTSSDGLTWSGGTATSLKFSNTFPQGLGLGGMSGSASVSGYGRTEGMTIESVAIFRGVSLVTTLAHPFDSDFTESTIPYKKWQYANAVVSFNSNTNSDIGSSGTSVQAFNLAKGVNCGTDYSCGGDTAYFGTAFWHNFCCYQNAYSAPGCVLRVATSVNINAGFNPSEQGPLTLGGLIVESSADGCSFNADNRSTVIGSASESSETWFGIKGNTTINRGGFMVLAGTVNIDIAEGKTFSLNASQTEAANYPTIKANVTSGLTGAGNNGGVLKMHGAGKIVVPTLTATYSTLDYSDLAANRATAFIDGALAINSSTQFKFPASATFPYPVATTISGVDQLSASSYTVGGVQGTKPLMLVLTSGKASPADTLTVSENTSWTTLTSGLTSKAYIINVTESAELEIDGDDSLIGVVINVAEGKTLTLAGSNTLTAERISITGSGKVYTTSGSVLAGPLTGAGTIVYNTNLPTGVTFANAGWTGTLWLENMTITDFDPSDYGNNGSALTLADVSATLEAENNTFGGTLVLSDKQSDGTTATTYALQVTGGNASNTLTVSSAVQGTGTLKLGAGAPAHLIYLSDNNNTFTGSIVNEGNAKVRIGSGTADPGDGGILITMSGVHTIGTGKTWTTTGNVNVRYRLTNNGSIVCNEFSTSNQNSVAVDGSGDLAATTLNIGNGTFTNGGTLIVSGIATIGATLINNGTTAINRLNANGTVTATSKVAAQVLSVGASSTVTGSYNGGGSGSLTVNSTTCTATFSGYGTVFLAAGASIADGSGNNLTMLTLNAGSSYTTLAGKEGTVLFAGAGTLTLTTTAELVNTVGHTPAIYGSGTFSYVDTAETGHMTTSGYVLVPYYNLWRPSGETPSISTLACWPNIQGGVVPTAGNVAFDVDGAAEVVITVDSTQTYTEGMVYGNAVDEDEGFTSQSGRFVQSSSNTITFSKLVVAGGTTLTLDSSSGVVVTGLIMVESGATLIIDGYTLSVPVYGEGSVVVKGAGNVISSTVEPMVTISGNTAELDTTSATFTKKTITIPSGAKLTLTGTLNVDGTNFTGFTGVGEIACSAADTLSGTIKTIGEERGVTISYPDKTLPTGATWTSEDWRGTVVLTNCGHSNNADHGFVNFADYGSVNSYIKAPGYHGYCQVAATPPRFPATLEIDSGTSFILNNGNSGQGAKFAKLTGSGLLTLDGESATAQYIFEDVSGFDGNVTITNPVGGYKSFVFGSSDWALDCDNYHAMLVIAGDVTIAENAVWYVPERIVVMDNKTLTIKSGATVTGPVMINRGARVVVASGVAITTMAPANCKVKSEAGDGGTTIYSLDDMAQDSAGNGYYTIGEALTAVNASELANKTVTLLHDSSESVTLPAVGMALNTNSKTYTGEVTGASGVAINLADGVYSGVANTMATWTGNGGDNLWSNGANWSTKGVPSSITSISFPAQTIEVGIGSGSDTVEVGAIDVATGGKVTFRHNTSDYDAWPSIKVCTGNITGSGATIVLKRCGLKGNAQSPALTVDCDLEFLNDGSNTENHDSWIEGATFAINGNITGTGLLKIKANTTINGNLTLGENAYVRLEDIPTFGENCVVSGSGRIILGTTSNIDCLKPKLQDSTNWTGICDLNNQSISALDLGEFGNVNSYVSVNGIGGTFKSSESVNRVADGIKGLMLEGNGLTIGDWSTDHTYVIAADISGSGPINFNIQSNAGNPLNAPASIDKVVFTGSTSDFTGEVKFKKDQYRPCYIFASESDLDSLTTPTDYGQIIVMPGKTVNVATTWSAPGGLIINGEANVSTTAGVFSGTITGSGTLTYTGNPTMPATGDKSFPANVPTFGASWNGTVVLPAVTISNKTSVKLPGLSTDNGTLVLKGIGRSTNSMSIYLGGGGTATIKGTTQVDGDVYITDGNSNATYTWTKVTGTGNLTLTKGTGQASGITHAITKLHDYTGTLSTSTFNLTIGTVNVSSLDLTVGNPIVKLASGCNLTTDVNNIAVTVNDVATSHKLYKAADGSLYVKVASVTLYDGTTTYYPTIAQAAAAADAALAAGTQTGEAAVFARVDSEAPTSCPGWNYADGTFTRNGNVAAIGAAEYNTLSEAIADASDNAEDLSTIKLINDCEDSAVNPNGKTFIFDENGYNFTGTFTGAGDIILKQSPSTTTWSSARFVSTGDTVWTGTVTLDWEDIVRAQSITTYVAKYGISGSTVEIGENGSASGYLEDDVASTLKVTGELEIKNGSSTTKRSFAKIIGDGELTFASFIAGGNQTTNYTITNLEDWSGILTIASTSVKIDKVSSGSGDIIYDAFNNTTIAVDDAWTGTITYNWASTSGNAIRLVGGANSKIVVAESGTGHFSNGANSGNANFPGTLEIASGKSLTINNAWSTSDINIGTLTGQGNLSICSPSGTNRWTGHVNCTITKLDGDGFGGDLYVGHDFGIKIGAIDFASAPTPGSEIVDVSFESEGDGWLVNESGEVLATATSSDASKTIPITVGGNASTYKAVFADNKLYVAKASVMVGNSTSYYATLADAIANISEGVITPLADMEYTLTEGQTLKIDNSGTYRITVSPYAGGVLGTAAGTGCTIYSTLGTIAENTATITTNGADTTLPETVTTITVNLTANAIGTITAPGVGTANVTVKYGETVLSGTGKAITVGKNASNELTFTLNSSGKVGDADVVPAVAETSPMTMGTSAASFKVKTIPGLYYAVKVGTSVDSATGDLAGTITAGNATQADEATEDLSAPDFGSGDVVKYYKVSVGLTEAEARQ